MSCRIGRVLEGEPGGKRYEGERDWIWESSKARVCSAYVELSVKSHAGRRGRCFQEGGAINCVSITGIILAARVVDCTFFPCRGGIYTARKVC
jgi:hypothetical protein